MTLGIAIFLLIVAAGVSNFAASKAPAPAALAAVAGDADATCGETTADGTASVKPCKTCPNKPYCTCTYNGQPRVSCEPCCWRTYSGGLICAD